jgi:predicted Fe-Mo cluster-binding NifX family protein
MMRIAISTEGNEVSPHFGRCPAFTIVEVADGKVVGRGVIPNPGHQPGFIPQFLHEKGVRLIVAGGMGPRAVALFEDLGMEAILGVGGNVDDVIDRFLSGSLTGGPSLCRPGAGKGYGVEKAVCDHGHAGDPDAEPCHHGPVALKTGKLKIAVTAEGVTLDSAVDPRFGRCRYFIIVDTETMAFETVDNTGTQASGGAGIQAGQLIASCGAKAILTGNVGPNAFQTLQAGGIAIYTGVSGTVREAVEGFKKGLYRPTGGPTAGAKSGMK